MQLPDQSNEFFNQPALQALANMRGDQGLIFSLYLQLASSRDLRPETRAAGDPSARSEPKVRLERLLVNAWQQKKLERTSPAYQQQWEKEAGRLRRALEMEQPPQAQGARSVAVFSSLTSGLWQVYFLPAAVADRLVVGDRPYVRPLELLLNEFKPTLVVLIDAGIARLVEVFLGNAEEVASIAAVPVTGDSSEDHLREHALRVYARSVAERTEAAWRKQGCDWLVIGGSDEPLGELREALSEPLIEHLAGEMHLTPVVGLEDVLARVQEMEAERERKLEGQRVKELTASGKATGSGEAVLGLEQTLLAVKEGRVRLLITEEDFHQAGGACPNCGYLGSEAEQVCPICGVALRPEPDIVETALQRVLDHGGEIEVLRSQANRRALESYGRIGALLRATGTPANKDSANRFPLEEDGKPNPDVIPDETIEESFPASDPPGNTH